MDAYGRAIVARSGFADAHFNQGNALMRLGVFERAAEAYGRALALGESARVLTNRGLALARTARHDEAIADLKRAIALDPRDRDARLNLAVALRQFGRTEDALSCLKAAVDADPAFADAFVLVAGIHHDAGRADDAREAFARALAADETNADALAGMAAIEHDEGRFAEAEALLHRVLRTRPGDISALTNLGLVHAERGAHEAAAAAFEGVLVADATNRRAMAHLAIALQHCGRIDEARAIFDFDRLVSVRPIGAVEGYDSVPAFNRAVASYVLHDSTLMLDRPAIATTKGSQTLEILHGPERERAALRAMIEAEAHTYIRDVLMASGNRYAAQASARWRMTGWAVVLRSGGFQSPHIHPQGFASGVYYVQVPEVVRVAKAGDAGHLSFGRSKPWGPAGESQKDFLSRSIKPIEGTMVLFPSHFWHYTVPYESEEPRICVAFDVVPT